MLIRLACDAYKAVSFIDYPCLSLGGGFVGELFCKSSYSCGECASKDVKEFHFSVATEGDEVCDKIIVSVQLANCQPSLCHLCANSAITEQFLKKKACESVARFIRSTRSFVLWPNANSLPNAM